MDQDRARAHIEHLWETSILPSLMEFVRVPCTSPAFAPDWEQRGDLLRASRLVESWCQTLGLPGLRTEVLAPAGLTPLLLVEVPGTGDGTVLLYGHLDKQPGGTGWREGLDPWVPVVEGDRLHGRGTADDGYAVYASLAAVAALEEQGVPHGRCIVLAECSEESGSPDLSAHIETLGARLGTPDLIVCLDSSCGTYDELWCTTSLRGMVAGDLEVGILEHGVHSGTAGGVVASTFAILRELLARLEDARTGRILLPECRVEIPSERLAQAEHCAALQGEMRLPLLSGARPVEADPLRQLLGRTWEPALEITGAEGLPALEAASNVVRPSTTLRLSLRLPPTCDAGAVTRALQLLLEEDPPHGARVRFRPEAHVTGWNAPPLAPWLATALERAALECFGADPVFTGEGGAILFMGMLGERFPEAQFLVTGVLGPGANPHGPDEFLHLPTARRLTQVVASVLAGHQDR